MPTRRKHIIRSEKQLAVLSQGNSVYSLAVLADGRLASGGYDGNIKLWPKEGTGAPVVLLHGYAGAMWMWRAETGLWEKDPAAPVGAPAAWNEIG